jgi:hypothetical protein
VLISALFQPRCIIRVSSHLQGQSILPTTCPVCQHTPISADDCKPNKTLRLTIRAFLKSEERKREKEKALAASTVSVPQPAAISNSVPQTTGLNGDGKDSQIDDNAQAGDPTVEKRESIAENQAKPEVHNEVRLYLTYPDVGH